jgi:hypothetical protein
MTTKSREHIYGSWIRAKAERAAEARKEADKLACEAWNMRMLGYQGPPQPSPALGDALNAGYASAAIPIRPSRWTLSGGRRQHPSMSWRSSL